MDVADIIVELSKCWNMASESYSDPLFEGKTSQLPSIMGMKAIQQKWEVFFPTILRCATGFRKNSLAVFMQVF